MPAQLAIIEDASMLCTSFRSLRDSGIDAPAHSPTYPQNHKSRVSNEQRPCDRTHAQIVVTWECPCNVDIAA